MLGKYITVYIKENTWHYCLVITPSVFPAHPDLGMSGGSYINLTARMGIPSMAACWWHPDLILHGSWSKKVIDGFYAHLMPVLNRCYTHLGCTCIIIVPVRCDRFIFQSALVGIYLASERFRIVNCPPYPVLIRDRPEMQIIGFCDLVTWL